MSIVLAASVLCDGPTTAQAAWPLASLAFASGAGGHVSSGSSLLARPCTFVQSKVPKPEPV